MMSALNFWQTCQEVASIFPDHMHGPTATDEERVRAAITLLNSWYLLVADAEFFGMALLWS